MKILTYKSSEMLANCYLIVEETGNHAVIVDPSGDVPKLLEKLREKNCTLTHILLTHGHFDHIYALEDLRAETHALVCIHAEDADCLTDATLSYMLPFAGEDRSGTPPEILLQDGDTISSGTMQFQVLHTPGHTMGSVCYVIEDAILTGDTLFQGNIGRYDLYGGDYTQLNESLRRLRDFQGKYEDYKLYPGHGALTRLSKEKQTNFFMK